MMGRTALWVSTLMLTVGCGRVEPCSEAKFRKGLQCSGAIGLKASALLAEGGPQIEISAPILPDQNVWQHKGGAGYPATQNAAVTLVHDTTMVYETLLMDCKAKYPSITLGANPTTAELATNYDLVSRCAYEEYGAKPYWMPQILDDVGVCEEKLGNGWRLLKEDDLLAFSEADFTFLRDTLSIAKGADWFPRQYYFSLEAYARGTDGKLKLADMNPGASHVTELPIDAASFRELYMGNGRPIGVRCARIRTSP